jgi:hypothetical protein
LVCSHLVAALVAALAPDMVLSVAIWSVAWRVTTDMAQEVAMDDNRTAYRCSEECGELFTALATVQQTLENVERDAENPAFKRGNRASTYASLGAVLDLARPKLAAAGLSICQMPVNGDGNNIGVTTVLGHKSGQWIESTLYVAPQQFTAQGAGSVITYLRRYAAMAMVGLAPEDDDGNAASINAPATTQAQPAVRQAAPARPSGPARRAPVDGPSEEELAYARGAWKRLHDAMEKAKLPKLIDEIVEIGADDLAKIKASSPDAYDGLIQFSIARKNEMLSAA